MNSPPNCANIPASVAFSAALARYVRQASGGDARVFTKTLILLPTRRSCRSLREAFLQETGGKPTLLPRIQPLGDLDEDELMLYGDATAQADIAPAIAPMRRQLLLTRLVMGFERRREGGNYPVDQAVELAKQLARFLDDVAREGLDFSTLAELVPEELAIHWQQTLDFLHIISHRWPKILEAENKIDPIERRTRLLRATASAWRKQPPEYPIIAAGSTGSQPATAELLKTIAALPKGMVILPGLDTSMPEKDWELLGETHPQFGLKHVLGIIGCKREQVQELEPAADNARTICLRTILEPPPATARWAQVHIPHGGILHIKLIAAETLLAEARMIATALREILQTPGKTAALVTPDRTLARMVSAQMRRFGVSLDDSAGRELLDTPPGSFLRLILECISSEGAPADLLALLRHPLAAAGIPTAQCRLFSRQLELLMLRGIRRKPGLEALAEAAHAHPDLQKFLQSIAKAARPISLLLDKKKPVSLEKLLGAHLAFAEWLATTDRENGAEILWAGEAGNALAKFFAELMPEADMLSDVEPQSYIGLFETLLAGHHYYPRFGLHPRLHILSPLEARLQSFDVMVLGGLNEGSWPETAPADPWMSRPMRGAFGLPPAERTIGQSAHDFAMFCHAKEVILTRARKVEGTPTVPSRWLVRLETLLGGIAPEQLKAMDASDYYAKLLSIIDAPQAMNAIEAPAPKPPLVARPRRLNVTAIDTWLRDPYMIYARYILKLKRLDDLDREPNSADFGSLVHKALELFTRDWPNELPENPYEKLLEHGQKAFEEFLDRPAVAALWWPRFEAMAAWLIEQEIARRTRFTNILAELSGEWNFDVDAKPFTLTTRIDRLEISAHGMSIIDYKTGAVPSPKDIANGLANQLPLEALIAMHGKLSPVVAAIPVNILEYWKLSGNVDDREIISLELQLEQARARLENLIREFDNADMAYAAQINPAQRPRYSDYVHLTRAQEWEAI